MGQGAEVRRHSGLPLIAGGTDVAGGNIVVMSGSRAWQVITAQDNTVEPIGVARASAQANPVGGAVDIRDVGDVVRAVAAATINSGDRIGVASVSTVEGASGLVQITQLGPVAKASAANRWSIGIAVENAQPKQEFAYYIKPQQLSGLT